MLDAARALLTKPLTDWIKCAMYGLAVCSVIGLAAAVITLFWYTLCGDCPPALASAGIAFGGIAAVGSVCSVILDEMLQRAR